MLILIRGGACAAIGPVEANMSTAFSETLCRIRAAEGFPTAYRFFHDNGGTQVLGFTYRQYLRMEQGKNLPECQKL